ncbi:RidA family protein [Gorillibacterium massiliense]|uniref:RidA family protein n=1 Tax=Gorillibacterium massiliense TaxID=1280390 RepID=UPI0004AE8285|nr:RidA family protein [Gorillibacterium massiliense]
MITRKASHYGDDTCAAYVKAGDFIYLAHHGGGYEKDDIVHQMEESFTALRATLESAGAGLDDMVQINLYLRNISDFGKARDVFYRFFKSDSFPARMSTTTDFVNPVCLCMLDGVAYKKANEA